MPALVLTSCDYLVNDYCSDMNFASVDPSTVSQINVFDTRTRETNDLLLATLTSASEIERFFQFFSDDERGWHANAFGVPVGDRRIVYFDGEDRLGAVSLGDGFLVGQGCGYFFARNLSSSETKALLEILQLEEHSNP
ncbi:MAG: hypothetical protein AAFY10_00910 [Pseudomonadota bacterium]